MELLQLGKTYPLPFQWQKDIEFIAKLYYRARNIGNPVLLSEDDLDKVIDKFDTYGQLRTYGQK
ncbi:MAG: hypothetical protein ACFWT6_12885 [Virgibacillus proomii]